MKGTRSWTLCALVLVLALSGCTIAVGDRVVGVESGKFIYKDGNLYGNYYYPMEVVWKACERTMLDLKAADATVQRKIATGTLEGTASNEKVRIIVEYVSKNETQVAVRVGAGGNDFASKLIHDKIRDNLLKEGPSSTESAAPPPVREEPPSGTKEPVKSKDLGS